MFRTVLLGTVVGFALLIAPASSLAAVIDFNAQAVGNNPNPLVLPGATFTTLQGFNYITQFGPNSLCTSISASSPADCSRDLEVLFDTPSSGISFTFAANNQSVIGSDIGDVQLFSGVTLLGSADVIVTDISGVTFDLVSLPGFSGVTRLLISSTDLGGVVYDDFTFNASAVPEPASWTMMLAGLGVVGAVNLRKVRRNRS